MAGLVRKKVTVRSKKGKTYQRSVMVRSGAKPSGRLRSQGSDHSANSTLRRGLANAGMGLGALAGGRKHNTVHMIGGAGLGVAAGGGLGHLLTKTRLSRNAKVGIGLLGHAVGFGSAVANLHRQITQHGRALQQLQDAGTRNRGDVSSVMRGLYEQSQVGRIARPAKNKRKARG